MSKANDTDEIAVFIREMMVAERAAFAKLQTFEEQRQYIDTAFDELFYIHVYGEAKTEPYRKLMELYSRKFERRTAESCPQAKNRAAEIRAIQAENDETLRHLMGIVRRLGGKDIEFDSKFC